MINDTMKPYKPILSRKIKLKIMFLYTVRSVGSNGVNLDDKSGCRCSGVDDVGANEDPTFEFNPSRNLDIPYPLARHASPVHSPDERCLYPSMVVSSELPSDPLPMSEARNTPMMMP